MSYFIGLGLNFIALFLILYFGPGLVAPYTETFAFSSALLFSIVTALVNASVFSVLILLGIFPTKLKLAIFNGIISYGSFSIAAMIPGGFQPDPGGAFIGGSVIWLVSFLISYFQMRFWIEKQKKL